MNTIIGYSSFNKFKREVRDIRQIYDITYHLYLEEHQRLKKMITNTKEDHRINIITSVGEIQHGLSSLYQRIQNHYPFKLRQLLLVSSVTSLEVYLTSVIEEISQRDDTPFREEIPLEFSKSYLLSVSSLNELKSRIIKKEIRSLTSGGFNVITKYYNKKFGINFKNLGISFKDIEEIHVRRHLCVHRNGICDQIYEKNFTNMGFREGDRIKIEHDYIIKSLNKLTEFASLINKELQSKFPLVKNRINHYGNARIIENNLCLIVDIYKKKRAFQIWEFLESLQYKDNKLIDFIVQVSIIDHTSTVVLSGPKEILTRFFSILKKEETIKIEKIIKLNS